MELTKKNVSNGEIDEQVVAGGPRPSGARARHEEEEVAENGDDDRHNVQGDPAPLRKGLRCFKE